MLQCTCAIPACRCACRDDHSFRALVCAGSRAGSMTWSSDHLVYRQSCLIIQRLCLDACFVCSMPWYLGHGVMPNHLLAHDAGKRTRSRTPQRSLLLAWRSMQPRKASPLSKKSGHSEGMGLQLSRITSCVLSPVRQWCLNYDGTAGKL